MLLFALLLWLLPQSAVFAGTPAPQVSYQVVFEESSLAVRIDWPEVKEDSVVFALGEWAGVDDFYRDVEGVTAHSGTGELLKVVQPDSGQWVVHCGKKGFRLEYRVICRKQSFSGESREDHFRPTILPEMGYVWGASALLMPTDSALEQIEATLTVKRGEYRMAASSLVSSSITTVGKLRDCLLIGGDYRETSRKIGELTLDFFMHGSYAFNDSQFVNAVERVLSAHIDYFGDYPLARQMVVLVEGTPNSSGGTVTSGVIAVYPDPTDSLKGESSRTLRLISHEHFHVWAEKLSVSEAQAEGYYKWFTEGFADYYADLTLYRTGLANDIGFVEAMNRQIRLYYSNPFAFTATADSLALRYWSGEYYNKLPYCKGALVGLLADIGIAQQTQGSMSLDKYLRRLIETNSTVDGGLTDSTLLSDLNQLTHQDWKPFYERFMIGAGVLPIAQQLRDVGITVEDALVKQFSLGFVTESGAMGKGERIASVSAGSAAEAAGLLPGDALVGYSYFTDDTTREAEFTVVRDGKTAMIKYIPTVARTIPQIVADSSSVAALRRYLKDK